MGSISPGEEVAGSGGSGRQERLARLALLQRLLQAESREGQEAGGEDHLRRDRARLPAIEIVCGRCGGPLDRLEPLRRHHLHGSGRRYCSPSASGRRRSCVRLIVVTPNPWPEDDHAYRTGPLSGWQGEMLSCGHTTEWHQWADQILKPFMEGRFSRATQQPDGDLAPPEIVPGARVRLSRTGDGSMTLVTEQSPLPYMHASAAALLADPFSPPPPGPSFADDDLSGF